MLHALRRQGRGDALEQLHQMCWSTAMPSGARNSLPLRSQQARRARVELAAKRVRPQWTWAMGKTGRQEASNDVSPFTGGLYRDKIQADHQNACNILRSHFFHFKRPKFTLGRPFCQLVTPTDGSVLRNAAPQLSSAPALSFLPTNSTIRHSSLPPQHVANASQSASHLQHPPATITPSS